MSRQCAICQTTAPQACSQCKAVFYCTPEHQKQHWTAHKPVCVKLKAAWSEGVIKEVIREAPADAREPRKGRPVRVHYTGTFADGRVFDSSRERSEPFSFVLGRQQVIQGWDEGVHQMRVGERAMLYLAPSHAYGVDGYPPDIPPNTPLIFDVEVLGSD